MNKHSTPTRLSGEEDRRARHANRKALEAAGVDLFPAAAFRPSHRVKELRDLFLVQEDMDPVDRPFVRVAGRITSIRHVGGIWFADVWQEHETIQLVVKQGDVDPTLWFCVQHLDLADFIGVEGQMIRTRRGEVSIGVHNLLILGKPATTPAIGKTAADGTRHGAQSNRGALLRHDRHVAFMTDPDLVANLRVHAKVLSSFRRIMEEEGYLELQTSIVGPYYGGAAATPFVTRAKATGADLFLRVSPEPDLKRALSGGLERVYEIGRNFRNEGIDVTHQPSFTAFECYAAWLDYEDMMLLAERLVVASVKEIWGKTRTRIGENILDFEPPWPRHRMVDLVARELGTTASELSLERLARAWDDRHPANESEAHPIGRPTTWGELLVALFEEHVEDTLIGPCFVIDHPVETSPLTKRHREDKRLTERFEAYVGGMEIANAYSELNDPIEQRQRLEHQDLVRDEPYGVDEYFLSAIEDGMPQAGGLGIGLDRLVMVISGANRISDVVPFPMA